jgi:TPR repeat protein
MFLAGAAAGIGGRYVAAVPGFDGVLAQAPAQMRAALALLPQGAPRHGSAVSEKLPAPPALPSAPRDRTTASAITAEPGGDRSAAAAEASPVPAAEAAAIAAAAEPPPAPEPASAPPAATRPPAALAAFALLRGDEAMKQRDVIAARRLYEFAASAGVSGAAAAVARSYDPLYLQQQGIRGVPADVATALRWYQRARDDASETPARAR